MATLQRVVVGIGSTLSEIFKILQDNLTQKQTAHGGKHMVQKLVAKKSFGLFATRLLFQERGLVSREGIHLQALSN